VYTAFTCLSYSPFFFFFHGTIHFISVFRPSTLTALPTVVRLLDAKALIQEEPVASRESG